MGDEIFYDLNDNRYKLRVQKIKQRRNNDNYMKYFGESLLKKSEDYYQDIVQEQLIKEKEIIKVIEELKLIIEQEEELIELLYPKIRNQMLNKIEEQLINIPMLQIINHPISGLAIQIQQMNYNNISLIYLFFNKNTLNLQNLADFIYQFTSNKAINLIMNNKQPIKKIGELIELKNIIEQVNNNCFDNEIIIHQSLLKGLQKSIQNDELMMNNLCIYSDYLVQKLGNQLKKDDLDKRINDWMVLSKQLINHDNFMRNYEYFYGRRLLNNQEIKQEIENKIIREFEKECGRSSINKISTMQVDLDNSKELTNEFQSQFQGDIEVDFLVVTFGQWPQELVSTQLQIELPWQIQQLWEQFTLYYLHKYPSRRLNLICLQGFITVKYYHLNTSINLIINYQQLLILLLFNFHSQLNIQNIAQFTNLSQNEIQILINHLIQLDILKWNLQDLILNNNLSLENKTIDCRFKSNIQTSNQSIQDNSYNQQKDFQVESDIMRITKKYKEININTLFQLINEQSIQKDYSNRYVKQRIESLISREYLERDNNNQNIIKYMP